MGAPTFCTIAFYKELALIKARGSDEFRWDCDIFPNFVVYSRIDIDINSLFSRVDFSFDGFSRFFNYRVLETFYIRDNDEINIDRILSELRGDHEKFMRKFELDYVYEPHFHRPYEVLLIYSMRNVISFEFRHCTYSIDIGVNSRGSFYKDTKIETTPIASIEFSDPVEIDHALDKIFEIRNFFTEMQASKVALSSISLRHGISKEEEYFEVYFSNLDCDENKTKRLDMHLSPIFHNMEWIDRNILSEMIRNWLDDASVNAEFHSRVAMVASSDSVGLGNFSTLCAAIDSLSIPAEKREFDTEAVERITSTIFDSLQTQGVDFTHARIKGLLSSIISPNFSKRLKHVIYTFSDELKGYDCELLHKEIYKLRNIAAHGGPAEILTSSKFSSLYRILLAMCCEYSLRKANPSKENESTVTLQRMHDGLRAWHYVITNFESESRK